MKTDRELLELAALAAGVKYNPEHSKPHPVSGVWWGLWLAYDREPHEFDRRYWNPLADDGDALRLAVKLELVVAQQKNRAVAARYDCIDQIEAHGIDPLAATRRAIVRAAAHIGATKETA